MAEQNIPHTPQEEQNPTTSLLFNEQIEVRVLTNILFNNNCYYSAGNLLSPKLFHDGRNAEVFKIIQSGISDGKVVDNIYVATELMRNPNPKCYVATDILMVFSGYVTDALFGQDLQLLREYSKRRDLWRLGQSLIRVGVDMSFSPDTALTEITKVLESNDDDNKTVLSLKEANKVLLDRVHANHSGKSDTFLETGFAPLDDNGGFQLGDLDVIAADSSMGKTSLVMNIAKNIGAKGKASMIYSMEMQSWQLAARLNAPKADTPANIIQYKNLTEIQYRSLQHAMEETDKLPIYFDDKSTISVDAIIASIRLNARKLGIKFFVIDYLQILSSVGSVENQEKFLGDVSRRLKNLAKELNVNITALSQLSRNLQDPRPTLSRVRASGQIVEAADTVLLIWRPEMYGKTSYKDNNAPVEKTAEIIIGKGRNIGTGSFVVHFDPSTTNFYDATADERRVWNDNSIHVSQVNLETPPPPMGDSENDNAPF